MALPIYSTPTLNGKDAQEFINSFERNQEKLKKEACVTLPFINSQTVKNNIKKAINGTK